jgi:type III restriction enzyme
LPILVINDEGHHCWRPVLGVAVGTGLTGDDKAAFEDEAREATVWVDGLDRLNAAGGVAPGISMLVGLSATPFRIDLPP